MAVKASGTGSFLIPTAPAVGTTVTGGAANTFTTNAVQLIASTAAAIFITGLHVQLSSTSKPTYVAIRLSTGAGDGSIVGEFVVPYAYTAGATGTQMMGYIQIYPWIAVAASTRIGAKSADSVGSLNHTVILQCINQSNVVAEGSIAETVDVRQYGGSAGTFSGGRPEVNTSHIAGSAVSTTTAQIGVNVVQISGDATAADNEESFFDGTGYAGTGNTIPTVTSVTNMVTANITQISGDATAADNLESYTDGTTPQPVNVTQLSGDATAADNAESFFDGTGYAGTGNTIPTVTTVTNLTNAPTAGDLTATMKASVNTEVDTALADINLDHLVKIAVDTNFATTVHLDSVIGHLSDNGTTATFDRTTDSLEALQAEHDATQAAALTAAGVRTAVGLASANLDTQLSGIQADTDDIQTRLPAALVSGRIDASVGAMATNVLTATAINADAITAAKIADGAIDSATFAAGAINAAAIATDAITAAKIAADAIGASELAADAVTEIQSGLSTLTAAGVRAAVGLASANLDTQLTAIDDYLDTEVAAIKAVTDALPNAGALTTIQSDLDDIQSRLPAALSGDGFIKADLKSIDDELTSGNNATLYLKRLDIQNSDNYSEGLYVQGGPGGAGGYFRGGSYIEDDTQGGVGFIAQGGTGGDEVFEDAGIGMSILAGTNASGGAGNDGLYIAGSVAGKSISALNDIAVSDGSLTLAAIASAVWANVTRTLTAISDSAGVTTLLSRIGSALNITSGKVESNVKQINDTNVTGDGSTTPWGPA